MTRDADGARVTRDADDTRVTRDADDTRVTRDADGARVTHDAGDARVNQALSPGFAHPVADAQRCFRSVLNAMARPGQVHAVGDVTAPAPLCEAAGAVLLTLVDQETALWLDPDAEAARGWITFHTGAPVTAALGQAVFALALALPDLAALPAGIDMAPETSATVILQVASLSRGARFRLSGPGLRQPAALAVDGLPAEFASVWAANHALFPCGVDLILCAGGDIAALPRSVTVAQDDDIRDRNA